MYQTHLEILLEKNAGKIISFCLFFILFTLMMVINIPITLNNETKPLSINLNIKKENTIQTTEIESTHSFFEPVKKIEPESEMINQSNIIDAQEKIIKEDNPSALNFSALTSDEIIKQKSQIIREKQSITSDKDEINKWLEKQGITNKGKEHLLPSDGKSKGVIRTLDLKDFPRDIINSVLVKYHIKISIKYVKNYNNFSFLNQADLGSNDVYQNKLGEGVFEVFELSPLAIIKMTSLEVDEMRKRNLISHKTRLREVHFGIIKNEENEYDLGIVKFEYDIIP